MLDLANLFKTLLALSRENDHFLVAQDSCVLLKSFLDQMKGLEDVIADYSRTVIKLKSEDGKEEEMRQYEHKIIVFTELLENRPEWESIISQLMLQAEQFWFCAPVDNINPSAQTKKSTENWRIYNEHREEIPCEVKEEIDTFKTCCMNIIHNHFEDLLVEVLDQEAIDARAQNSLPPANVKNATFIPIGCWRDFNAANNSLFVVCTYPLTHFSIPDPKLAKLLGYSVARLLAVPFLSYIVNSGETNEVVNKLNKLESSLTTQIYYRTVSRSVVAVRWEVCSKPIEGHLMARGIEVTKVMEACRGASTLGTEKLLRNWLHSIRNASFQQQAEVIQDEVEGIWNKLGRDNNLVSQEFENLSNSIKTLIYTSRASVGLIDQALSCQDMMNSTEVAEFVNAISVFADNFAKSEGLEDTKENYFKLFVDGELTVKQTSLEGLVVRGDMTNLKTLIDNIYSNAIRYTDPKKGVLADLHIHIHAKSVQFVITIEDHGEGLPNHIVRYYKEEISSQKITDVRERNETEGSGKLALLDTDIKPSRTSDRSSLTGIPHIVDLYHEITESGDIDFNMSVIVKSTGTTYTLTFAYDIIVPTRVSQSNGVSAQEEELIFSSPERVVLIADDSHVVRRILERYLSKLKVPFMSFPDGTYALEWYKDNHAICMGVITDLEMPQMGGLALISHIKEMTPDAPCYIISGNNIAVENVPSNVLGALVKPVTMEQLKHVVVMLTNVDMQSSHEGDQKLNEIENKRKRKQDESCVAEPCL